MWSLARKFLFGKAPPHDGGGPPLDGPGTPPDGAGDAAPSVGPDAPTTDASRPADALEERLREAVARGETAVGGRVNLLNLSKLAERYGPRWPMLAEKVDQLIRLTLSRRLSPRDVFRRFDEGVYIVMLDGLSESEARLKCALLADEIATKLLGQTSMLDTIDVCSAVAAVDGAVVLKQTDIAGALNDVLRDATQYSAREARQDRPTGPPAPDAVEGAVSAARGRLAELSGGAAADPATAQRLDCALELLQQAEAALLQRIPTLAGPPPGGGATAPTGTGHTAGQGTAALLEARLDSVRDLIGRAEALLRERHVGLRQRPIDADDLASADLEFLYRPLWHVSRRVINAYRCEAAVRVGRRYITGDGLFPERAEARTMAMLDRTVLLKALEDAVALLDCGGGSVIVVPVHHSTLSGHRASHEYIAVCRSAEPALRPFLVWEVIEPSNSLSGAQVAPVVATLKPYGRAVLVRTDVDRARLDDFVGLGVYSVGADIGALSLPEQALTRKFELFRARAGRYGLRSYLHGVPSTSVLAAAVGAGFDYIDGDGVLPWADRPGRVESFDLFDLYSQRFCGALHGRDAPPSR